MSLRDTIDELDALVDELANLRQQLRLADLHDADDIALREAEDRLRRVASRAERRADLLRRAVELRLAADLADQPRRSA